MFWVIEKLLSSSLPPFFSLPFSGESQYSLLTAALHHFHQTQNHYSVHQDWYRGSAYSFLDQNELWWNISEIPENYYFQYLFPQPSQQWYFLLLLGSSSRHLPNVASLNLLLLPSLNLRPSPRCAFPPICRRFLNQDPQS